MPKTEVRRVTDKVIMELSAREANLILFMEEVWRKSARS